MGSDSISEKTLSDESKNRSLVCAHIHLTVRAQKILTFCPRRVNVETKTHHDAPSMKTECDYLNGWIKNGQIYKQTSKQTNKQTKNNNK